MSTRRDPQKSVMNNIGARVRQRAMSGTEASTVGFVLVLYVFAGAGLGYLADKFLETNWIVAAGVLGGSALGFREMFRMIKKISSIEASAQESPVSNSVGNAGTASSHSASATSMPMSEEPAIKPRTFQVPPPPTASFDNPDNPKLPR